MPVLNREGATAQQRGYIIGLVRKIHKSLPTSNVRVYSIVMEIERQAKVGDLSEEAASWTIDELKRILDNLDEND
jgi:hypothetical protein